MPLVLDRVNGSIHFPLESEVDGLGLVSMEHLPNPDREWELRDSKPVGEIYDGAGDLDRIQRNSRKCWMMTSLKP